MVNLALVLYLVITRRLFGVRGGKDAYEARLKEESILQAAIAAAAAEPAGPRRSERAGPAGLGRGERAGPGASR